MTTGETVIYRDSLLHACVVVEYWGLLWLVPESAGGWARRLQLTLSDEARRERLKPASDVDPEWLGIDQGEGNSEGKAYASTGQEGAE